VILLESRSFLDIDKLKKKKKKLPKRGISKEVIILRAFFWPKALFGFVIRFLSRPFFPYYPTSTCTNRTIFFIIYLI
jgi:hypothetical protein